MLIMSLNTFLVSFFVLIILNGNEGCFTESQNHTIHRTKGMPFYEECVCETPGYNARHIKWLDRHNQEIDVLRLGTDQKAFTERQNNKVSLYIPNVTKAVSGLYRCVTNFEGRDYSQSYYIEAYEPVTINPPEEQFVLLGNRSLVKCKVHAEDMSKILISWTKVEADDTRIELTNNDKYDITDDGLYINDVTDDDKGKYSCSAYDKETLDEVDKDINVKIIIKPMIKEVRVIPDYTLVAGSTLVMKCVADGIPQPEYIWRRTDTGEMDNQRWKKEANAIMIDPVLAEDQGQYECVAQSLAGVVTKSVDIQVFLPPNITSFPSISEGEGSTVQLVCNANGRPAPNISIIFFPSDGDDDVREADEDEVIENLSFIVLDRSREGIYVCNASNEVNYTTEEMYLTVFYKPHYDLREEIVWGWDGHAANLSCAVDSNPIATIKWGFVAEQARTPSQMDPDNYISETLRITMDKYLPVNISKETHSLYGWYECNATNYLGVSTKKIHFREGHVPPSIKNASVVSKSASSATFYIEQPDYTEYFQGPSVHGYIAEYDTRDTYNITNIHLNRSWSVDRPFTIDHLKPNTSYNVRFAAVNQVGYSEWSDYLEFVTLEPSVPGTPIWKMDLELLSDEAVNVTDTNQALSWKISDNNDAPVEYYKLKYCPVNEEKPCKMQKVEPSAELKADLNILDHNTTYFIELVAHNNIGDSEPTNITITTPAQVTGDEPRLSAGALIGISVVVVFVCLLILDLLLLLWKRQGMIATCCCRKKKSKLKDNLQTRDKKGLLKDSRDDSERSPNNRPKEYEYNKTTGIITGKHSAV